MPKLKCVCSEVINLNEIPSPHQYLMISDQKYDNFQGLVDTEVLYREMIITVKCPTCSRLHIFENGFDNPAITYKLES